jgi:putative SOS response-associated peptidase YedK
MCGRYTLSKKEKLAEMLRDRFVFEEFSEIRLIPRFNIAPTQQIPVILNANGHARQLVTARWGLVPSWAKDEKIGSSLVNARCETIASKAAFRSAFQSRRCLVPADGFYEWQKTGWGKVPHYFTMRDESLFAFAGLWESWRNPGGEEIRSVSLITTQPNALVAPLHDRMPVILTRENESAWLDQATPADSLTAMLSPYPAEEMKERAVSTAVNSAREDSPALLAAAPSASEFRLEG